MHFCGADHTKQILMDPAPILVEVYRAWGG